MQDIDTSGNLHLLFTGGGFFNPQPIFEYYVTLRKSSKTHLAKLYYLLLLFVQPSLDANMRAWRGVVTGNCVNITKQVMLSSGRKISQRIDPLKITEQNKAWERNAAAEYRNVTVCLNSSRTSRESPVSEQMEVEGEMLMLEQRPVCGYISLCRYSCP